MKVRTVKSKTWKKFLTSLTILSLAFSGQVALSTTASAATPSTLLTFETGDVGAASMGTNDFGGVATSVADAPAGGSAGSIKAGKLAVTQGAESWAGALIHTSADGNTITSSSNKVITMNVYSPVAGLDMHVKLQVGATEALNTEMNAASKTVVGWQTMTFDFATSGSPWSAWDAAKGYTGLYLFPAWTGGTTTATTKTAGIFYIDDIAFNGATTPAVTIPGTPGGGSGGGDTAPSTLVTFESDDASGWSWIENWFGASSSVSSEPPAGGSSGSTKSGKIVKTGDFWSGTTFLSTNADGTTLIDSAHKVVTMNVYAPDAGKKVLLQLKSVGASKIVEKFATQLTVVGWQTLTFDFSLSPDNGSPAFDSGIAYDKASVMFSFAAGFTNGGIWYFDDVAFNGAVTPAVTTSGGGSGGSGDSGGTPAVAVAHRLVTAGSTGLIGTPFDKGNQGWFSYYSSGVKYYTALAEVGSAVTLKWHVTNTAGAAFANQAVDLIVGKSYSSSTASFSTSYSGHASFSTTGSTAASDARTIPGTTDANGDVSWTLTNTDIVGQTRPADLNGDVPNGGLFAQIALLLPGGNQSNENQDIIDLHFVAAAAGSGGGDVADTSPSTLLTFETGDVGAASMGTNDFEGATTSVADAPAGGSADSIKAAKIVIAQGGMPWAGALVATLPTGSSFTSSTHKIVTMNVYSPVAGEDMHLKLEGTGFSTEMNAAAKTIVGWQTMTFNFENVNTSKYAIWDATKAYNKAIIFPAFTGNETDPVNKTAGIFYIDDVAFNGATTPALVPVVVPPVVVPPVVVIDAAAVQAAIKVATAQAALGSLLGSNKPATLDQYRDASYFIASQSALVRVNAAVSKLSAADRAEMSKVMEIIKAENFIDRIANPLTRPGLTSTVLIKAGLLSSSSSYKYSVLAGLQGYKEEALDSLTKIAAAIKAEIAKANYRKERTLEIKAKMAARQKR
jgi:hypothetical protein